MMSGDGFCGAVALVAFVGAWARGDLRLWAWVLLAGDLGWVKLWRLPLGSGG